MGRPKEFEIIDRYFTRATADPSVRLGIGDDAAVVAVEGEIAIAVDTIVAGTHFPENLDAAAIGHRCLAVNLSDMAAMGARPRWATLALTLPAVDEPWIEAFAGGFFALADRYQVSLIGGDTTRGPLTVTVQIAGELQAPPLLRSGGRVGDLVFVSGSLGDAAAAVEWLGKPVAERPAAAAALIERFRFVEPRVDLGIALAGLATAAIDVSDGLLADLGHLCRDSGCGALIDLERLPRSESLLEGVGSERALVLALNGGDDYELCFAAAPEDAGRVIEVAVAAATPVTAIGELTAGRGIEGQQGPSRMPLTATGFRHFD